MPTTEYNVRRIQERVSEKSIPEILDTLDEIQLIVYSQDCAQTMKIGSEGVPPYLVTTNNQYQYDCPADCRRTAAILSIEDTRGYSVHRNAEPRTQYNFRQRQWQKIPATSVDATVDSVATVTFRDNPGSTTQIYYHLYHIKPTALSDISIQLTIPEYLHWRLRKAVIAMFNEESYGSSPLDESIIEKVARDIRNGLNKGWQGGIRQTPIPLEYQRFPYPYYGAKKS